MSTRRTPTASSPVAAEISKFRVHAELHPGENTLAPCTGEQYAFEGEANEDGAWIKPPYRVYRHGPTVTSQIEDGEVKTITLDDEDRARGVFANECCDRDGPGAIQPGDTIRYGIADEKMAVVAVARHDADASMSGAFTVFDGTKAIDLSYWEYRIIRRPAPVPSGTEVLAALRAEFAEWHADRGSSNDWTQITDDFLTEHGLPTVMYEVSQPAATDGFVRHTCKNQGRFGRLAQRGACPRCDELHDGAPRRGAPAAIQAGIDRRAREERDAAERAAHYARPNGRHWTHCVPKANGGPTTCYEW